MKNVFVTRKIPEAGIKKLKDKGYTVEVSEKDGVLTREELIWALEQKEYDAVLCLLTDTIDAEIFKVAPSVKIFANYAVGFDNIDVDEAKKRNIVITNTPGVLSHTVAEHTFALLMAISRRVVEADRFVRDGNYKGWAPMLLLGSDLEGKTLGILGAGRIGSRVAYHGKNGYDMNIIYYDIKQNQELERELGAQFKETVEGVLKEADFVSIHVPLLDSTHHLINKDMLALMKPSAYLINTSRGGVIDEKALKEALENNTIQGAAIDVFEQEPIPTEGMEDLDNIILTPHIASATQETRSKMAELAAENIIEMLEGGNPPNRLE